MKAIIINFAPILVATCALSSDGLEHIDLLDLLLPEDAKLNFTQVSAKYGHTPEQYEVITEDGYILTLFRLRGRSPSPVFLQHGILDSTDTWLLRGPNSLGITLANNGYDVWMGNSRGNRYSRRHISLNPDVDAKFWDFSFNEIGYYDLPAFIDKILNETGASSISAIAHSQGTTAFFVLGSTKPEYNIKINVMIALAPVCYLHHSPPPIATFIKLKSVVENFFDAFNIHEFLGDNLKPTEILRKLCGIPVLGYEVCVLGLYSSFTGYDPLEIGPSFFRIINSHFPAGTSAKSLDHYLQVGYRKTFAPFDYGDEGNRVIYNSSVPPPYALSNVTFPTGLLAARNDYLSTLPDVALLKQQLGNVVYYLVNPRLLFNHVDHTWGRRMPVFLFPYIFKLLRIYNRSQ
ncbi:unnamed protein product, partial [Brenthis ino]